MSEMETQERFRISPDRIDEIVLSTSVKQFLYFTLVFAPFMAIQNHLYPLSGHHLQEESSTSLFKEFLMREGLMCLISIPLLFIFSFFSKRSLQKYLLTIDENGITKQQSSQGTLFAPFNDIAEAGKYPDGTYLIKNSKGFEIMRIPKQIGDYERFETLWRDMGLFNENPGLIFF